MGTLYSPAIEQDDRAMLNADSSLPPSPWIYNVPDSDITMFFSDFGPALSELDAIWCLLDTETVTILHWGQQTPIGPLFLVTKSGDVELQLRATNDITWYQWATAIRGLTYFVDRYEAVNMYFNIQIGQGDERRVIAGGVLTSANRNHTYS